MWLLKSVSSVIFLKERHIRNKTVTQVILRVLKLSSVSSGSFRLAVEMVKWWKGALFYMCGGHIRTKTQVSTPIFTVTFKWTKSDLTVEMCGVSRRLRSWRTHVSPILGTLVTPTGDVGKRLLKLWRRDCWKLCQKGRWRTSSSAAIGK